MAFYGPLEYTILSAMAPYVIGDLVMFYLLEWWWWTQQIYLGTPPKCPGRSWTCADDRNAQYVFQSAHQMWHSKLGQRLRFLRKF